MAVSFVIGRAGSGKTKHCLEAIVAALQKQPMGPPIYWILPRQATFAAERQLACESDLAGFSRARVLSFDGLGREILADVGGAAVPEVDDLGRRIIVGFLLRKHQGQLRFFKKVAQQAGLAERLGATFAELERLGKDAGDLAELLKELGPGEIAENSGPRTARLPHETTSPGHLPEEPGGLRRAPFGSEPQVRRQSSRPPPVNGDDPADGLRDKIYDLRLIYEAYSNYLGQERLDQHHRLLQVLAAMEKSRLFAGATVYIDAFWELTQYECRVIAHLGKVCAQVEIALMMDARSPLLRKPDQLPDELSLFYGVEMAYRRLWFALKEHGIAVDGPPLLLQKTPRFGKAALTAIERHLYERTPPPPAPEEGLKLLEAPTPRGEVDAAARQIHDLLAQGLRFREMAVIVRDLEVYHELIDASFREHAIEFFVDRRRPTAHHPLVQMIRALLWLGDGRWAHEPLMTLLKCGLCDLGQPQSDELENYVLGQRIRGKDWEGGAAWNSGPRTARLPYEANRSADSLGVPGGPAPVNTDNRGPNQTVESSSAGIEESRRKLIAPLLPFIQRVGSGKLPAKTQVAEIFGVLERFNVRQTLSRWIDLAAAANQLEQRGEHEQAWNQTVQLFDTLVDLIGDEELPLGAFGEVVETALDEFDLGLAPVTVDAVLVGQADRTRIGAVRAVLVLGLNEGVFPRTGAEDSVLSDADRRAMRERHLEVDAGAGRRLLDENLLGYAAFTRASEFVYASCAAADAQGKPLSPSPFWRRLREIFPRAVVERILPEDQPQYIGTQRQLVSSLMHWVREYREGQEDSTPPAWPALYQWLATQERADNALAALRQRGWSALSYRNVAQLSVATAAKLFASPLRAGVDQIESFAACPFQHFAIHALGLQERSEGEFSAVDMGSVYHKTLDALLRQMLQKKQGWTDLDDSQRERLVHDHAQEIGRLLRGQILLSSARNRYFLERIEKTLGRVILAQKAAAQAGKFRPAFSHLQFGPGGRLPALRVATPKGHELQLHGRIDRVDFLDAPAPAEQGFTVIDYRLGKRMLGLDEVYYGISLRLLTYLLVVEASGRELAGRKLTPAAAFYVQMLRQLRDVAHPDEAISADDPAFDLQIKPRGIVQADFIRDFDANLQTGASSVITAYIKADGKLGNKSRTDAAEPAEFTALLAHVRRILGQLADGIMSGCISVAPYLKNQHSPCPNCPMQSVCRFDASVNRYRPLNAMSREQVLQIVRDAKEGA